MYSIINEMIYDMIYNIVKLYNVKNVLKQVHACYKTLVEIKIYIYIHKYIIINITYIYIIYYILHILYIVAILCMKTHMLVNMM